MQLIDDGVITQDEALAHADSPSNLYWLINNHTPSSKKNSVPTLPEPERVEGATFTEFTLDL